MDFDCELYIIIIETSYLKLTIKGFSIVQSRIITVTSYLKLTIKSFILHYKYRQPSQKIYAHFTSQYGCC